MIFQDRRASVDTNEMMGGKLKATIDDEVLEFLVLHFTFEGPLT